MSENEENVYNLYVFNLKRELRSLENFTTDNIDAARLVEDRISKLKHDLGFITSLQFTE